VTTKLDKLKWELMMRGDQYVLTISAEGFKLVPKGKRLGLDMRWDDFVSGDAPLATSLKASVHAKLPLKPKPAKRAGMGVAGLRVVKGSKHGR
jgi:hypothetical protein